MSQARATRYFAENGIKSAHMDIVTIETERGGFQMGYEEFQELFGLEIKKGGEVAFDVAAVEIAEKDCEVPR